MSEKKIRINSKRAEGNNNERQEEMKEEKEVKELLNYLYEMEEFKELEEKFSNLEKLYVDYKFQQFKSAVIDSLKQEIIDYLINLLKEEKLDELKQTVSYYRMHLECMFYSKLYLTYIASLEKAFEEMKKNYERLEEKVRNMFNTVEEARNEVKNVKERTRKEIQEAREMASLSLIEELLPVIDTFKRAMKMEPDNQGLKFVWQQFESILKNAGLDYIEEENVNFDENLHEAIDKEEVEGLEEEKVVQVLNPGYKFKGKVIVPAKVKVAVPQERED